MTDLPPTSVLDLNTDTALCEVGEGLYVYAVPDGPTSGVIIGDDAVMVIDAQPSSEKTNALREAIRSVTEKPISYLAMTHYHAGRTIGAAALGASQNFMSDVTRATVGERGQEDWDAAIAWRPDLFRHDDKQAGLAKADVTFRDRMTLYLGQRRVHLMHLGKAHTSGDIVAWVPDAGVMFTGDIIANGTAIYCGDACFKDWSRTLDAITNFAPEALVTGSGAPLLGDDLVDDAIDATRDYILTLYASASKVANRDGTLQDALKMARRDCDTRFGHLSGYTDTLPFNIARAFDEAQGIENPRIWTADGSQELSAQT